MTYKTKASWDNKNTLPEVAREKDLFWFTVQGIQFMIVGMSKCQELNAAAHFTSIVS